MASFTVRVELHSAVAKDYENLHSKMEAAGFSRQITADSGVVYHLPTAEYDYSHSSMTTADVRDKAAAVAQTVKQNPAVLVTKSDGRSWQGLDKV